MVTATFFPKSLPNETISSRIGRYHILSGNRTSTTTFKQLGFPVGAVDHIVSPYLEAMASRLPGDAATNFVTLIRENTLLPLFKPFLGKRADADGGSDILSRLPRWVVGNHGESYLCIECVKEAKQEFGFGYWMRSHQAPGVSACWKHGCELVSSCSHCEFPFQHRGKCLSAPWYPCKHCAREIDQMPVTPAAEHEKNFARYVQELLQLDMDPIPPDLLSRLYRKRIQELGFVRGAQTARDGNPRMTAMTKFTADLTQLFGGEFIAKVDKAYASGRTSFWIRFSVIDGVLDMPLSRHILLGMRLFGTAAAFHAAVLQASKEEAAAIFTKKAPTSADDVVLRDRHRARIVKELKRHGKLQLKDLWRNALRATSWLFENDRKWLEKTLLPGSQVQRDDGKEDEDLSDKDMLYAAQVEARSRELLAKEGRPERITIERLFEPLPISPGSYYARKKELPLLAHQVGLSRESTWCLRARRILWAIGHMQDMDMKPLRSAIPSLSSVSYYAVKRILEFSQWDIDALASRDLNIPAELARVGITLAWQGPGVLSAKDVGGRAYTSQTGRRRNRDTSLLRTGSNVPEDLTDIYRKVA